MNEIFGNSFSYKVIYIFQINDNTHKGLLKIGDAKLQTDESVDKLSPNCKILNQVAKERIKQYTNTAGINVDLLHTELAVRIVKDESGNSNIKAFRDHHVHRVLENSGIMKKKLRNSTSREWFELDLATALKAIEVVKQWKSNLSGMSVEKNTPIIFRPEQEIAIEKTLKHFKTSNNMLWNAKMRFGKTLSALEIIKQAKYNKTIIITHRPVVDKGWYEDFTKIFYGIENYIYGSKTTGDTVSQLVKSEQNFVYFASIQDLRGSDTVGGKFEKNDEVFNLDWDFVIVDEAHEGTTTKLGADVIGVLVKENTKLLELSGTPFNIIDKYSDNIYTWDYVMEQSAKNEWDKNNFGDSNPYEELPELKIFTYDLGKIISDASYVELEDKAFNFREFFRVWTGNIKLDNIPVPSGVNIGDFYHKNDVLSFLNLITKDDKESKYPYSNKEYQNLFKHSLWMLPGVKEAKALSKMLKNHSVFGNGAFEIVNVAGDGDEEERPEEALSKVKTAIKEAGSEGYTITLSCGKLTTGVTVPQWTAVFMLSGSFSTSAANYLQTIFRVQSPCNVDGKIKSSCYVFDFAPDRTLKMVAESASISSKAGKTSGDDRHILGEFLNYCPVIAVEGTTMVKYDTNKLLQQLKKAYAERAVQNEFDDNSIYNEELLKLDEIELKKFEGLKKIVGSSKAQQKTKDIDINNQGFNDEDYEKLQQIEKKKKAERTPAEEKFLEENKEKNKQAIAARSILRGISIRMPLLIYGADIDINEEITMQKLVELVDDSSWVEFMPTGVTKAMFKDFIKYYDPEIFVSASRKIRNMAKSADYLSPTERVQKIAQIFSNFKNPDKETVLTPWRVVNMHLGDTLGGYNFYDESFENTIDMPRLINHGEVTEKTLLNNNSKILEINSKTGLYPLYVTYSVFKSKCNKYKEDELTNDIERKLWFDTVEENVFVICKTPMAKSITKRTLVGYNSKSINAHYFDDLINTMKNKQKQFVDRISKPNYWNLKGSGKVKFDAIVGNPPYMEMDGGAQASASPIYQYFIKGAKELKPNYASFIIPTRWYAGGKGLDEFRDIMLNDKNIRELHDCLTPESIFPNTNIRGGVCYFLWDENHDNNKDLVRVVTHEKNEVTNETYRLLKTEGSEIFIRDSKSIKILEKVFINKKIDNMTNYISSLRPFGFRGYFTKDEKYSNTKKSMRNPIICYGKGKQIGYVEKNEILIRADWIDSWKVYTPRANNVGTELNDDNLNSFVGEPKTICTESYLVVGANLNLDKESCENITKYFKTKFARYLHSLAKVSQDATSKTFRFVPLQNFTNKSDINWKGSIKEIDKQLYKKYNFTNDEIDYVESKIKEMG